LISVDSFFFPKKADTHDIAYHIDPQKSTPNLLVVAQWLRVWTVEIYVGYAVPILPEVKPPPASGLSPP
jgi:hypothetical protein